MAAEPESRIELHPVVRAAAEALELAGVEQKRHRTLLVFAADEATGTPLEVCATPGRLAAVAAPAVLLQLAEDIDQMARVQKLLYQLDRAEAYRSLAERLRSQAVEIKRASGSPEGDTRDG